MSYRREKFAAQIKSCSDACDRGLPMLLVKFDEAAERVNFEIWAHKKAMKHGYQFMEHLLLRNDDGTYRTCWVDNAYDGWLACAKSRHNESTMQGEE